MRKITVSLLLILSFCINAQDKKYSDKEIGFDRDKITKKLLNRDFSKDEIDLILQQERAIMISLSEAESTRRKSVENNSKIQQGKSACTVPSTERQALIDFYNSTNGSGWTDNTNWNTSAPVCDWYGVNVSNGHVNKIQLSNNNLSGTIPSSIEDLTQLDELFLFLNNITGAIPTEIGNLSNLVELNLTSNDLSGPIPSTIGNLNNLEFLNLGSNDLIGNIPSSFSNLSSIKVLSLNSNDLSGTIPSFIWSLTTLEVIQLGVNNFSGTISTSVSNLTNLQTFSITANNFSGTIPTVFGSIGGLLYLYLGSNEFEGTVPASIGNLISLIGLSFNNNNLEGTIPPSFQNLVNLEFFNFNWNAFFGDIPSLTTNDFTSFNFNYNRFIFSDFEDEFPSYNSSGIAFFAYAPQAKVDQVETITVYVGQQMSLTTILSSPNNTYQWYKDGVPLSPIVGVNEYTVPNVTFSDAGVYYFTATNSIINGLTLERYPITVIVEDTPPPTDCEDCYSFKPIPKEKYILSAWTKERVGEQVISYLSPSIEINYLDNSDTEIGEDNFFPNGRIIEEWQRIFDEFTIPEGTASIEIVLKNKGGNEVFFDDIRIHPFNGSMKSFVYDPVTQRLMAELDENNYSTFYEYDLEGGLIRVKKETEKGVYTIQETRSKTSIGN
ncbi:MAG: immunoglobulin domain-containing protein [Bacteroidota bacterium]